MSAKNLLRRIPLAESLRAFLEQWGVWKYIVTGAALAMSGLVAFWSWLESQLPYWAIGLVFLGTLILLLAGASIVYSLILQRRHARVLEHVVNIDRDPLAKDLEELSRKIAALVGEYRGPMQEAWWKDALNCSPDAIRESHSRIEGQLIEKYSYRFASDVWKLIRRASKIVPIDRSEIWHIQHGITGERSLVSIYIFLAKLADDIRHPKAPMPMTDHDHDVVMARALAASLPES